MKLYDLAEMIFKREAIGEKIARLFIGESELATPPAIAKAGISAINHGRTRYAASQGEFKLRKAIAEREGVEPSQVMVTPGSKFAVFAALKAIAKPGDNVCILSPHWPGYLPVCEQLGVKPRLVKSTIEEKWMPSPEKIATALDSRTHLVVVCNPGNPTSTIIESKKLGELVEVAHERRAYVLLDEAYKRLAFQPMGRQLDASNDLNLVTGSFSKGFAMTGWRIGYLLASEEIIRECVALAQATYSCVPQFTQDAALKALELPELERRMARIYQGRAKLACKILAKKFRFIEPQAGFYVFAGKKGLKSNKFCLKLLDEGIGVAPGSAFGYDEFIRISLTLGEHELEETLKKINEAV